MRASTDHRRTLPYVVLALLLVVVAGCSTGSRPSLVGDEAGPNATIVATTTTLPAVDIGGTPGRDTDSVPLDSPIVVKVPTGTLKAVTVEVVRPQGEAPITPASDSGAPPSTQPFTPESVAGGFSDDRTIWLGGRNLRPATTYQVTATAEGTGHRLTLKYWRFTTVAPTALLHTQVNVFEGSTYGLGMPVVVQLSSPVDKALHPEVERRLHLTTSNNLAGAWRWFTNSELHWRPAQYWPPGTKASLAIDFKAFNAGNGVWGVDGRTINFSIGDAHIATVDANTHQMTVTTNGAVERTIPVSTGRDEFPTKSGTHVIMTREASHRMDSSTIGIPSGGPGGYVETVKWALRISNSGEFVHSAPWSTGDQGNSNVSHGCVNVSPSDGEWFFNHSRIGDVVSVINTPDSLAPDNGYGDWQIPWSDWAN